LAEIGSRTVVDAVADTSPAGRQCALWYPRMRQQVLRTAPWGFARRTVTLTESGTLEEETSPYPYLFKYVYPTDCMKFRYVLPPPTPPAGEDAPDVSTGLAFPWCGPSREWRYLVSYDVPGGEDPPAKVLVSNLQDALGVYTADVEDPDVWDSLFSNALVMALASKFVMALSGNVGLKQSYEAMAMAAITQARAVDGNEAIPSNDPVVDWIAVRGLPPLGLNYGAGLGAAWGMWNCTYDNLWGM
jgi:hypothetical protein